MTRPSEPRPTYERLRSGLREQRLRLAELLDLEPEEIGIEINAAQSGLVLRPPVVELVITQLGRGF
jgi:hypothetical protein